MRSAAKAFRGILPSRAGAVSLALISPLALFLAVFFLFPILSMLTYSVYSPEMARAFPTTFAALKEWNEAKTPDEPVFAAMVEDLRAASEPALIARGAKRLTDELPAFRALALRTRHASQSWTAPYKDKMIALDPLWGEIDTWWQIKRTGSVVTGAYLLSALDLRVDRDEGIVPMDADRAVFTDVIIRTFTISSAVTALCLLLGFPVANQLARLPAKKASVLMLLVLLPLWTSLLVRSSAWVVVLQTEGLVNTLLQDIGLIETPLQLIFNRTGVVVALTHVLLPFMILPLYATMKAIPDSLLRAAGSLGAKPIVTFWKIYLPLTTEGILAGCLLCFTISLGYYLTPLLVGGSRDQMISYYIANYTNVQINWGMAAALSVILLVTTAILFFVYSKFKTSFASTVH